jgi:hypothetical protein
MITADYLTEDNRIINTCTRSARLYYRSQLLRLMRIVFFSLPFVLEWMKESQTLPVQLDNLFIFQVIL